MRISQLGNCDLTTHILLRLTKIMLLYKYAIYTLI
jgi:hypothetical protein